MDFCTRPFIPPQLAAQSVGPAYQLFSTLIHTLYTAQCNLSPSNMWPVDHGPDMLEPGFEIYDFIIVGAGAAGSTLANRLSEVGKWKILLLEAGSDPPIESVVPLMFTSLIKSRVDWELYGESPNACKMATNGLCYWARGKMLGGSTSMNFMAYVRGVPEDFDEWANAGNLGWDYESVLQYFKKSEGNQYQPFVEYEHGKYHNGNGPLKVSFGNPSPLDSALYDMLKATGVTFIDDINADKHLGSLYLQSTAYNGTRQSTAKVFLSSAKNRTNLHVVKNAVVTEILLDSNNNAYGLEFVYNKKHKLRAYNKKDVIVSAGALMSPPLLMRSGIGPKKHLKANNIPCKVDLAVGQNLIDHVYVRIFFSLSVSQEPLSPLSSLDMLYQYLVYNSGRLSGITLLSSATNTLNNSRLPDIQTFYTSLPRGSPASSLEGILKFANFDHLASNLTSVNKEYVVVCAILVLMKPKSRGTIELSKPPSEIGVYKPNFLSELSDRETLIRAMQQLTKLWKSKPFLENNAKMIRIAIPECDVHTFMSNKYCDCYIRYMSTTGVHPVGTSKMGPKSDENAVVDSNMKVHGTSGLRQIDAGVIPVPIRANTQAASIMVGEKGADIIKKEYL